MKIDSDRIDDAVLALLHLGLHDKCRTWKGFDWDAMNRLHEKGYISDPVGKTKSVVFTEDGLRRSQELFREMFMINGGEKEQTSAPWGDAPAQFKKTFSCHPPARFVKPRSRPFQWHGEGARPMHAGGG